jgi:hypothetical protein
MTSSRRRGLGRRQQRDGARAGAQRDTASAKRLANAWQESACHAGVDQQRLQGIACGRTRALAVDGEVERGVEVGAGFDVQVANALVVADDRHAADLGDMPDQAFAAARDHQREAVVMLQQFGDGGAFEHRHQHRRIDRQADGLQAGLYGLDERGIAVRRLPAAAQHAGVSGLEAEHCGIDGHVRARFVDHRNGTERCAHPPDLEAIGARRLPFDPAQWIGQRVHGAHGGDQCGEACGVEPKAILHRGRQARRAGRLEILRIGCEHAGLPSLEGERDSVERRSAGGGVARGEAARSGARGFRTAADESGFVGGHSSTRSSRWITVSGPS